MKSFKHGTRHSTSVDHLAQKGLAIDRLINPYLDAVQLKEYGIIVSQIDLDELERFPSYFVPATQEKLASLGDRRPLIPTFPHPDDFEYIFYDESDGVDFRFNYSQADHRGSTLYDHLCHGPTIEQDGPTMLEKTSWIHKCWTYEGDLRGGGSPLSSPEEHPQEWHLRSVFETRDGHRPHITCTIYQGVNIIGPLLRTEVLTIAGVIWSSMETKEGSETHRIFPLIMISMIGTKGRILQAHYDGDKLYIQYSKLYEFKYYDKDNIDLFLRWMMTEPIGDTAITAPEEDTAITAPEGDTAITAPEEDNDLGAIHKSSLTKP